MTLGGGLAVAINENAIPWFVAAGIFGVVLLILYIVDKKPKNPVAPPDTTNAVAPASPVAISSKETYTPDNNEPVIFGALSSEIEWMANRSALKWTEVLSAMAYPVEHARLRKREVQLYARLNELGIKLPRYGDGRWYKFWVELVFASESHDLAKARRLLDALTPKNDPQSGAKPTG